MKIERVYPENLKNSAVYDLLTKNDAKKVADNIGARIAPKAVVVYVSDTETRCIAIEDVTGEIFRSSSNALITSVTNAIDILGTEFADRLICPVKKMSKNGREYTTANIELG